MCPKKLEASNILLLEEIRYVCVITLCNYLMAAEMLEEQRQARRERIREREEQRRTAEGAEARRARQERHIASERGIEGQLRGQSPDTHLHPGQRAVYRVPETLYTFRHCSLTVSHCVLLTARVHTSSGSPHNALHFV